MSQTLTTFYTLCEFAMTAMSSVGTVSFSLLPFPPLLCLSLNNLCVFTLNTEINVHGMQFDRWKRVKKNQHKHRNVPFSILSCVFVCVYL